MYFQQGTQNHSSMNNTFYQMNSTSTRNLTHNKENSISYSNFNTNHENHKKSFATSRPTTAQQRYTSENSENAQEFQNEYYQKLLSSINPDKCMHENIVTFSKNYCKDCGMFFPKNGAKTYREIGFKNKQENNPDEVYMIMLECEPKNREHNSNSFHLKYRKILVDWICEIGEDLKFTSETIHVTVSYIDTVLSKVEVPKNKLQLVCLCCLLIAAKFSENDAKVPPLKEVHEFCRGTYSLELFRKTEMLVLEMLDWDLKTITPYQFTQYYLAKGCAFSTDNSMIRDVDAKLLRYLRKYAEFFVDLSLQDYEFIKYESHIVACASIAGARKAVGLHPVWNDELTELTETVFIELESCFEELYKYFELTFPEIALKTNPSGQKNTNTQIETNLESSREKNDKSETPFKVNAFTTYNEKQYSSAKKDIPLANANEILKKNEAQISKSNQKKRENSMMIEDQSENTLKNGNVFSTVKRNLMF